MLTLVSSHWPVAGLFAVTIVVGVGSNGWVGLFFSELARLAPADRTAEIAGGGQSVMYSGIVAGPLVFGALLGASGSYAACWWLFAGIALASFVALVMRGRGE